MFQTQSITDFADPRLAPFRSMRAQFDHLHDGVFVAEGEKVVRRLLESSCEIVSVLLPPKWQAEYEPLLAVRPENIELFVADREVLTKLTGFSTYQGLLGLARVTAPVTLADLNRLPEPRLLVALDGLTNAENVGTVVRNLVALGGQALVVGETSAHPYLRRAVRSSMGGIFKVPYTVSSGLVESLAELRSSGVRCVAAHPHTEQRWLWDVDFTRPTCLVLGAEGEGIRPEVLSACDEVVALPMSNGVDSLNVANAAAVFLAEVQRQRGKLRAEGKTS
ncbi:MAG: RNA methyltransferase [Verrucomicrobia bacterium]|nr:RNA methyltransferase [Verrucomicrobiota bacterium]